MAGETPSNSGTSRSKSVPRVLCEIVSPDLGSFIFSAPSKALNSFFLPRWVNLKWRWTKLCALVRLRKSNLMVAFTSLYLASSVSKMNACPLLLPHPGGKIPVVAYLRHSITVLCFLGKLELVYNFTLQVQTTYLASSIRTTNQCDWLFEADFLFFIWTEASNTRNCKSLNRTHFHPNNWIRHQL